MPTGYDPSNFPTSYTDPAYDAADQEAAQSQGIPVQWLTNIRTKGEKSNANQISSANAATPYQIIPSTRQSILDQTGVDPYLNPQAAAQGAAYTLKQNLGRYGGNPVLATAAYAGGSDQSQWGPSTLAYTKRVTGSTPNSYNGNNPFQVMPLPDIGSAPGSVGGSSQTTSSAGGFQVQPIPNIGQAPGAFDANSSTPSPLAQVYSAYQGGKMTPEDKAAFEQDVANGRIVLPAGSTVSAPAPQPATPPAPQMAPPQLVNAFNNAQMAPEDAAQLQKDVQSGALTLPPGATLTPPQNGAAQTAGVAARGYATGLANTIGSLVDKGKSVLDLPVQAISSIANGGGPLNAVDQMFGTHLARPGTQASLPAIAPQAAPVIPNIAQGAQTAMNRAGLPVAQTPNQQIVQAAAQGAGAMTVPFPGVGLSHIPQMIAAGATGGAVGESVHQATGSPLLGAAANLITTAMSPMAAARMMQAMSREVQAGQAAAGMPSGAQEALAPAEEGAQQQIASANVPEGTPAPVATLPGSAPLTQTADDAIQAQSAQNQEMAPASPAPVADQDTAVAPGMAPTTADNAGTASAQSPSNAAENINSGADENVPAMNPAASPIASATQQFLSPEELAQQTRRAVGSGGLPFGASKQSAREILASQSAPDPETLAAAQRLGIADNLQPDHVTSNQAYRELAQAIKSSPGSIARSDEMQGLQAVGDRAQQIVADAGGMSDLSELSSSVKGALSNTQQQLDQKADGLYSDLRDTVAPQMAAPASNTLGFVQQRINDLGGVKNLSPTERMIQSKLTPKELPITMNGEQVSAQSLGLPPQVQQPSYALLDDVRKSIGSGLRNQGPFKDADTGLLKALYGRISEDQRAALSTVPGAVQKFDAARAAVQMRKSVEDDMTSLYGKQLGDSLVGKLGTAITALPKGDESKFVDLIQSVPKNMRQQVTASGLAYAFGKATKNGDLNFKNFADWMDGLKKNSGAFNAVMGNLPTESRQQLLDLAKVSRGIANATRENITTGRIMAAREDLNAKADGFMSNILTQSKRAAVGGAIAGAAHVAGPIGAGLGHAIASALSHGKPEVMDAADKLIVSPEFIHLTRNSAPSEPAIAAASNSGPMRKFYGLAKAASGANDSNVRQQWLRSAIASAAQNSTTVGKK